LLPYYLKNTKITHSLSLRKSVYIFLAIRKRTPIWKKYRCIWDKQRADIPHCYTYLRHDSLTSNDDPLKVFPKCLDTKTSRQLSITPRFWIWKWVMIWRYWKKSLDMELSWKSRNRQDNNLIVGWIYPIILYFQATIKNSSLISYLCFKYYGLLWYITAIL